MNVQELLDLFLHVKKNGIDLRESELFVYDTNTKSGEPTKSVIDFELDIDDNTLILEV